MGSRIANYESAARVEGKVVRGGVIADGAESERPIAMVRDLPANFFAVGRMHESVSFMVIDSKEIFGKRMDR